MPFRATTMDCPCRGTIPGRNVWITGSLWLWRSHRVSDWPESTPSGVSTARTPTAVSFFYELPFGTGRTFLSHRPGWVNQIVGGWRASGVLTLQSGLPFTPVISGDLANTGVSSQRPNAVGAPILLDNVGCWFYVANNSTCRSLDPSATAPFTVPAQYTYGTSGRDVVRSDGLKTLDFSLLKKFKVTESKTLEFRAECFNLANHPVFSAPSATINATSGGQVSSLLVPAREVQLALKFYF